MAILSGNFPLVGLGDEKNQDALERHKRDNQCLLRLSGFGSEDPMPSETLWKPHIVMWPTNIFTIVYAEIGQSEWDKAEQQAKADHGLTERVRRKNSLLTAYTLEQLHADEKTSPSLEKLCSSIIDHAST